MNRRRALALALPFALLGVSASQVPWTELTENDWLYRLATRFSLVEGHQVHYPTPPAELAKLLEARSESAALRQLAEARLALGDRKGAMEAMAKWGAAEGAEAQAETARWAAAHHEMAMAFQAADKALPGLAADARRALSDLRIGWADQYPELADPIALRRARAESFPDDEGAVEAWLRALEKAGRLAEVDQGLAAAKALNPERRLLLRSDLLADHGDHGQAFQVLDAAMAEPWSLAFRRAYAQRVDKAAPSSPQAWRATLDARYDEGALLRLDTYFQGKGRGDASADLLRQMERRYESSFGRREHLLLSRLHGEIDATPEAFRARLAAAQLGSTEERNSDLAELAQLALRAGGRPLAWGGYNDEAYHWAARVDRTPGFWTGGLSFLLTGLDWKEAMGRLESETLPDRTFAVARALADELARRSPGHPGLPALRVAIMERHVERGEGREALAILPSLQSAPAPVLDRARRTALLAARQTRVPLDDELRLMKERLRFASPDGSRPSLSGSQEPSSEPEEGAAPEGGSEEGSAEGEEGEGTPPARRQAPAPSRAWSRIPRAAEAESYADIFQASLARLEHEDRSHSHSLDLILTELDRLPQAESLWMTLSSQLEGWKLDDELGPRYERALQKFDGPGIWDKLSRWYARRGRDAELHALAESLTQRFRGAEIFRRSEGGAEMRAPEQPPVPGGVRLVRWSDWVRLKALERFPHSQVVFREASRLLTTSQWKTHYKPNWESAKDPANTIVPDELMETRRWAVLFVDAGERESYFEAAMLDGSLERRLSALESRSARTPVEDLLLFEGWARLSRFERAIAAGDHLAAAYPADGALAGRVLSLHRSLNGLESSHAAAARALVERSAPALEDPAPLWTELGELEEERGRPAAASADWQNILAREPRNPERVSELATLLWDYNHDKEALQVVEQGRVRLNRPRFFAFETGVLRENVKDLEGAIREYLEAARLEGSTYGSAFEQDQRSLRRLAQLLSKDRVYRLVARRIEALKPGQREDEEILTALLPLSTIEAPHPGLAWDADDWIDNMDQPNDPKGRELRKERRQKNRPAEYDAISRIGDLLLDKSEEMIPQASSPDFLDAVSAWSGPLRQARWDSEESLDYEDAILARRARLAPTEEDRIRLEVDRARVLSGEGRAQAADAVWATLLPRIDALPEGPTRLRAEADRAGYLERSKGPKVAAEEWRRITARHPWSLGLLEDRLAFLDRAGLGVEGRNALEEVIPKAATGHRESLLERLVRDCLAAGDLGRAHRAVAKLLAEEDLDEGRRMEAIHLQARLSFKENPAWDPAPLAKAEAAKLDSNRHADLYHELARAADLEGARGTALGLWIEALNRRTDRDWLVSAARSAAKAGKGPELLAFFEKQHLRSPRDVRWAVAVRDIKRAFHQVDGAIEAAQSAVAVRPEKRELWQEAADLMVRDGRILEAANYLEGWSRPRPADEGVARWRSGLYARAGESERAFAIESATLQAFAKEHPGQADELAARRARAASSLMEEGLPQQALRLYSAKGDIRNLRGSRLAEHQQCDLALLTDQFTRLLDQREGEEGSFLRDAASRFSEFARPEQRDEVQAWLLRKLYPLGAQAADDAALDRLWPFISNSGLQPTLQVALAERLVAARPGPWTVNAPVDFLENVGADFINGSRSTPARSWRIFHEPDLALYWMRDLTRRDRPEELLAFMEPRWQELIREAQGTSSLDVRSPRQAWAYWMDRPEVLACWARAAAKHPEKIQELALLMGERRVWDRFWVLAARGWSPAPLVALLPEDARLTWFHYWDRPLPAEDPVLLARRRTVDKVSAILARLVQGVPGTEKDFIITKLRGPQTVGEVLGKDSRWTWSAFDPRRNAKGDVLEVGDDRIIGQGADQGRLPGALWGERPGEAWFVLEAMARFRQGDRSAALLPLAVPRRGGETDRALLAIRSARALGDLQLALELESEFQGPAQDRRWLEERLSLLTAAGQRAKALADYRAFLKLAQAKLTEEEFHWLQGLADSLGLPAPMELLDASQPVGPVFLAYLHDQDLAGAAHYQTKDQVGFRIALTDRWRAKEAQLSREQIRFWLRELWAEGAAPLPRRGLEKLGSPWRYAGSWLQRQRTADRIGALDSLEESLLPGPTQPPIFANLEKPGSDDVNRLLALRLRLGRGESERALALVDAMLAERRSGQPLSWSAPQPLPEISSATEGEEGSGDAEAAVPERRVEDSGEDPLVSRLRAWLAPFKEAKASTPVEARFLKLLQERRAEGPVTLSAWTFAFRLTPAPQLPALAAELDEAWFRGEISESQAAPIAQFLATAMPSEAPRWLARWPRGLSFSDTRARAATLVRLKDSAAAAQLLLEMRRKSLWQREEEIQAFDLWRRNAGTSANASAQDKTPKGKAPASWTAALPFWNGKADQVLPLLGSHLKAHPNDRLATRAALRSLGAGDGDTLARISLALQPDGDDASLLKLREARGLMPVSARAAGQALGSMDGGWLAQLLSKRHYRPAEITAALSDVARIAARNEQPARAQAALEALSAKDAAAAKALRAELALAPPAGPAAADAFRMVNGRPAPILPRDLTWTLYAKMIQTGAVR